MDKQGIGIPMWTDCAPFLVNLNNLYLFALEHQWICRMQETGEVEREYIDDLLAVDDDAREN